MRLRFILFDLDGTLYPNDCGLLQEVGQRIQDWVRERLELTQEQAAVLHRDYYLRYGTTLGGLIAEQEIDVEDYLAYVHDVPLDHYLQPDLDLARMLAALPLRRAVYTNGSKAHCDRVLRALGISALFEHTISVEDVGLRNKLHEDAYEQALTSLGAQASECVMVEDTARNLRAAKGLGMTTILVGTDGTKVHTDEYIDLVLNSILEVGQTIHNLLEC